MAPPADDVSTGELARSLNLMRGDMQRGFTTLEQRLGEIAGDMVHKDVYQVAHTDLARRVDGLEERNKWMARAIAGGLISLIVAVLANVVLVVQLVAR